MGKIVPRRRTGRGRVAHHRRACRRGSRWCRDLAQLGEPAAAAQAGAGCRNHHPLARQMRRQRRRHWLARRRCRAIARGILGRGLPAAIAASVAAVTSSSSCSSNWSISLQPRSEEAPNLSCLSLAISSFNSSTSASAPEARASALRRAACSAASAARSMSISSGVSSGASITPEIESRAASCRQHYPATSGHQLCCGLRQSMPSSM
jgi:hypothetical protein